MVLSFTNAAADHIKELQPTVRSSTIASMIHDIYSANYKHNLSTLPTFLNSLKILRNKISNSNPNINLDILKSFINTVAYMIKDEMNGLVDMSDLVSQNYDEIINIMNEVAQTTLEMEQIIAYYGMGKMKEPVSRCSHLIMDEVQDSSIFEFIYIIRYTISHNSNLYLVGDGSQTLYEFRSSNPDAMNAMEGSNILACHQLQTNYRSNQNILDMANILLKGIKANSIAKIQLRANSFVRNNFEDEVKVQHVQITSTRYFEDTITHMFIEHKPWIDDKLAKGEKIAFLSYKRSDTEIFEKVMKILYPNHPVASIIPPKQYSYTFFTKYIAQFGNDFHHKNSADATNELSHHFWLNINYICYESQQDKVREMLKDWQSKYRPILFGKDIMLQQGKISSYEFKNAVFDSLIEYEIDKNAAAQRMTSVRSNSIKNADLTNYPFIRSTIHSAKGLEFDNVILLVDESKLDTESDKRMYYVGLTRAKNAELVFAYSRNISSPLEDMYEMAKPVVAQANNNAGQPAMPYAEG